jgi:hypothetical protein
MKPKLAGALRLPERPHPAGGSAGVCLLHSAEQLPGDDDEKCQHRIVLGGAAQVPAHSALRGDRHLGRHPARKAASGNLPHGGGAGGSGAGPVPGGRGFRSGRRGGEIGRMRLSRTGDHADRSRFAAPRGGLRGGGFSQPSEWRSSTSELLFISVHPSIEPRCNVRRGRSF